MNEEFDELLKLEEADKETIKLKKSINHYIYKRIIIIILIISVLVGSLVFMKKESGEIKENTYFNPIEFHIENLDNRTSTQLLLSCFYNTQFSAVQFNQFDLTQTKQNEYQFSIQEIADLYTISSGDIDECTNITLKENEVTFNHKFSIIMNEYAPVGSASNENIYNLSKEINDLEKLPDSSILEVSLSFNKNLSINDFIDFTKKYPDVMFEWACVDNYRGQTGYGINLGSIVIPDLSKEVTEKYPYIIVFDYRIEEQLKQHYKSCLQLLKDYPEFSNLLFEANYNDSLENQYEKIQNEITFIGTKVYITKDDLISGIKNGDMKYGMIKDIRYSKYER